MGGCTWTRRTSSEVYINLVKRRNIKTSDALPLIVIFRRGRNRPGVPPQQEKAREKENLRAREKEKMHQQEVVSKQKLKERNTDGDQELLL